MRSARAEGRGEDEDGFDVAEMLDQGEAFLGAKDAHGGREGLGGVRDWCMSQDEVRGVTTIETSRAVTPSYGYLWHDVGGAIGAADQTVCRRVGLETLLFCVNAQPRA